MAKTSVVICELNPLHTGHKRLLDFARTFSDNIVCVMSGNFVQRGMPAVCNKFKRAVHAVRAGADLVVELPTFFATASAEDFAWGGVQIANMLGADYLVFGSECGDVEQLKKCAQLLDDPDVNRQIAQQVKKGLSYPKAVQLACGSEILQKPNNTLAVEYIRAIQKTSSKLVPVTCQREDNFNGQGEEFASSTALRADSALRQKYTFDFVCDDIDDSVEEKYKSFVTTFLSVAKPQDTEQIYGVTEGLHNRIFRAAKNGGFEEMMAEIKTKRYTRAKLQRVLLRCVLSVTDADAKMYKSAPPQIKVLAVKKDRTDLLANPSITNETDEITQRADKLYSTFDGEVPPVKLIKV